MKNIIVLMGLALGLFTFAACGDKENLDDNKDKQTGTLEDNKSQ